MAEITASQVKALRDKTGAGMMDCKAALAETDGDMEAAVDWLRAKGLSKAATKAGRVAAEGLVAVAGGGTRRAAVVELNAETDFVARNDTFQSMVATIAETALSVGGDYDALLKEAFPGTPNTVEDQIREMVGQIGATGTHHTAPQKDVNDVGGDVFQDPCVMSDDHETNVGALQLADERDPPKARP
jgi:elongation factor Ts